MVCAGNTVSFYAVNPSELEKLKQHLKTFSSHLPKDVIQSGDYLK
jgi:hypothetical protein